MKISKGEWILLILMIAVMVVSFIAVFCSGNGIIGG